MLQRRGHKSDIVDVQAGKKGCWGSFGVWANRIVAWPHHSLSRDTDSSVTLQGQSKSSIARQCQCLSSQNTTEDKGLPYRGWVGVWQKQRTQINDSRCKFSFCLMATLVSPCQASRDEWGVASRVNLWQGKKANLGRWYQTIRPQEDLWAKTRQFLTVARRLHAKFIWGKNV